MTDGFNCATERATVSLSSRSTVVQQMIDQMAAREAGAAGDQGRTRHGSGQERGAPYCASWYARKFGSASLIGLHHHSFFWYHVTVSRRPSSNGTCGDHPRPSSF